MREGIWNLRVIKCNMPWSKHYRFKLCEYYCHNLVCGIWNNVSKKSGKESKEKVLSPVSYGTMCPCYTILIHITVTQYLPKPHTNLKRLSIHTVVIYREIKRNSESSYHLLGCVKTLRQRNTHYVVKITGKAILEGSDFGCTRFINKPHSFRNYSQTSGNFGILTKHYGLSM